MKIISRNLHKFLEEAGVLNGPENLIQEAKIAYRRLYKRSWKKNLKKSKELRPTFTCTEFEQIVSRAKMFGLTPTAYARDIVMSSQEHVDLIPNKDKLLYILASITMAENELQKDGNTLEAKALLFQAEEMLLTYLNIKGR